MSFYATEPPPRHQQRLVQERSSTIGTDELGSDVSKISEDEEEDFTSGSAGGRRGGGKENCPSSCPWDAYPPEIGEWSKDLGQMDDAPSDDFSRDQRKEQGDEVEDLDRFLYSDDYLVGDDLGGDARLRPQSPQENMFTNDSGGGGGGGGGGADDFCYGTCKTDAGGDERVEERRLWSLEQAVPDMTMTYPDRSDNLIHGRYPDDPESVVGQGSGGDFWWESTDEDATKYSSSSLSSGWGSFNDAEISHRDQEKQQQQQRQLHDEGEDVDGGVPELHQDLDMDDILFARTTTEALQLEDFITDAPPIPYDPIAQSCHISGDQTTNTAYSPTVITTRMLPISHSSSSASTPTPPQQQPKQPQHRRSSEAPASASKPTPIPSTTSKTTEYMSTTERPRDWILEQLEGLASQFLYQLSMGERPVIELACRNRMDSAVYDQEAGVIRRRRRRVDDEVAAEVLPGEGDSACAVSGLLEEVVVAETVERFGKEDNESEADRMEAASIGKRQRTVAGCGLEGKRRKMIDGRTNNETKTPDDTLEAAISPKSLLPLSPISPPSSPFTKRSVYGSKRTRKILRATELIHENVSKDTISSKRDMYYRDVLAFGSQPAVDGIVEDLACTFEVPRANLNVVAGTRSVVFGSVRMLITTLGGKHRGASGGERLENEKAEGWLPWSQEEIADSFFSNIQTLSHKQQSSQEPQHYLVEGNKRKEGSEAEEEDPLDSRFYQTSYNTLVPIPVRFSDIVEIEIHPRTRFVLVIEKEATFSNLISLGFCELQDSGQGQGQGPCILLTSKGFPDQVARQLVKALEEMVRDGVYLRRFPFAPPSSGSGSGDGGCISGCGTSESPSVEVVSSYQSPSSVQIPLDIPILALVDCDPHGIEIYLAYRCGSIQSAYDNANLAVPALKCLGQVPSDWDLFFNPPQPTTSTTTGEWFSFEREPTEVNHQEQEQLRTLFRGAFIPLTDKDRKNLGRLMTTHPYICQHTRWREQIERMLEVDAKTELQSLHLLGLSYGNSGSATTAVVEGSEVEGGGSKGSEGTESKESVDGAGGLVAYLQHKLQDPQSWL
jgi:meiotic recombination protein SPO11